jgi:hypothetical protein
MVMRLRVGDAKADWNHIEERRVGYFDAPTAEIVTGVEDELEPAGARLVGAYQRLVAATVCIGHDVGDEVALRSARQLVKLHPNAFRRRASGHVEDMGRDAGQILLPWSPKRPPPDARLQPTRLAGPGPMSRRSMRD